MMTDGATKRARHAIEVVDNEDRFPNMRASGPWLRGQVSSLARDVLDLADALSVCEQKRMDAYHLSTTEWKEKWAER